MCAHRSLPTSNEVFADLLASLYGAERVQELLPRLERIIKAHRATAPEPPPHAEPLSERDALLITYADQVQRPGERPLQTLAAFLERRLSGLISGVHILPFFPSSSDDGFAIIDYRAVDPAFGTWGDVGRIAAGFRLMVDAVINHVSATSAWFQAFLEGDPRYADFFISVDPEADLSQVVRPRDLPLLTEVQTASGSHHVWTTFSADQIDLNYANPEVLLEIIDLLLFYVRQGAQIIRLDAIAYLWKDPATPSIHLPQTHRIVKLLRAVLEAAAPSVLLITETNVPHAENISYFGDGSDEAYLIYQFALPPLVLHTFHSGDASKLTAWASELALPSDKVTYFNFLASHDGIGLRPAQDILSEREVEALVELATAHGGRVSHRRLIDADPLPYELNINYLDALTVPAEFDAAPDRAVARFLASQAIMLAMVGLPGIYFHSLFGSRNDLEALARTGRPRSINREKMNWISLERELADPKSLRSRVYTGYAHMLAIRSAEPAFDPFGSQQVFDLGPMVFALLRTAPVDGSRVLCLHEVTGEPHRLAVTLPEVPTTSTSDLLTGQQISLSAVDLSPYQVRWIRLDGNGER